jgi:uncharacterized protein YjlB
VQLGGEAGPEVRLGTGDVAVLPAGTGHKRLAASRDLLVIGGYPPGQEGPAILRAADVDAGTAERCAAVPLPASDPVNSKGRQLQDLWKPPEG